MGRMNTSVTRASSKEAWIQRRDPAEACIWGSFPHGGTASTLLRSPDQWETGMGVGAASPVRPARAASAKGEASSQSGGWAWMCQASSQVAMATETKRGAEERPGMVPQEGPQPPPVPREAQSVLGPAYPGR